MTFSRENLFDQSLREAAFAAKAFCHPERLRILQLLHQLDELNVHQIAKLSPLTRETVSQHLTILREHGLVNWSVEYPYVYYSINYSILLYRCERLNQPLQGILKAPGK